jgi:enoyl-CoA hydratase
MTELILRNDHNGLSTLILNRPEKLNALNLEVFRELRVHVDDLEERFDTIGCVVLKGNGRCFSSGHDLSSVGGASETPEEGRF